MGKRHYITQKNENNCGAYCTTYLLGEYLNSTTADETMQNAEKAQEEKILDNSWNYINFEGEASNPFKIQKYLSDREYENAIIPEMRSRLSELQNGLKVSLKIKLDGDDITQHPLHYLLAAMQNDAGITGNPEEYLETDIDDSFEYMMGVFRYVKDVEAEKQKPADQEEEEQDPGDYHYILIHRTETGWEYINPHQGEWEGLSEFSLNTEFTLPVKHTTNAKWKWMDFGLFITKNE